MKKEVWELTGDPFVDNGLWIISELTNKLHPTELHKKDIKKAIEQLKILLKQKEIESVYRMLWVNHPVFQNSYTPEEREIAVGKIFDDLLDDLTIEPLRIKSSQIFQRGTIEDIARKIVSGDAI